VRRIFSAAAAPLRLRGKFPPVTATCCIISVVLYVGVNLESGPLSWEILKKWGTPDPIDIYSGAWWGLVTSNFLHTALWHLLPNLYWLGFSGGASSSLAAGHSIQC
jgi:GlpG protein